MSVSSRDLPSSFSVTISRRFSGSPAIPSVLPGTDHVAMTEPSSAYSTIVLLPPLPKLVARFWQTMNRWPSR